MRDAISIEELQQYAERLPKNPRVPWFRLARYRRPELTPYLPSDPMLYHQPVDYSTIEFRAEDTTIRGVRATAWFYHDLLVKVCV